MPRIPTPLTWKRRNFAVFEPLEMTDRLYAVAVSGLVSGPFAIYNSPHGRGFVLIHLPSQAKIIDVDMQNACKDAAEKFAALDLNWWTCITEEVIGPDLQEMRNIHLRLKPTPWIASDWGRGDW
ncbi:MAG TPA: hypothetical protein VKM72_04110 [Thermoanaerobaculia bacterium]|nr:hypothetical protein [Thermoanaerobaculia bacterium]